MIGSLDLKNMSNHELLDDLAKGKKVSIGVYRMFSESIGRKN